MSKLTKRSSSSKKFEGAVECTDFECVTFQDKPYQMDSRPLVDVAAPIPPFTEPPCRFERSEGRQSFNEGTESKFGGRLNQSSIATVNNLTANDRRLSQSHVFGAANQATASASNEPPVVNQQHQDAMANLQRKRPGSARYARPVNGVKHGSSSSLSSASSASSTGSYSNNIGNGFGHPEHAELIQSINASLNQLSLVEDMQDLVPSTNAPPLKPKRPSTDRVKTTMAFYANKPSFSSDNRQPSGQVSAYFNTVSHQYWFVTIPVSNRRSVGCHVCCVKIVEYAVCMSSDNMSPCNFAWCGDRPVTDLIGVVTWFRAFVTWF